jgi:hypothetical protein
MYNTHLSLQQAMKYKKQFDVKIELIHNDKPNAYIYKDEDLMNCNDIFKRWYDILGKLKDAYEGNKVIKHIISSLLGHLSASNKIHKTHEELEEGNYQWGMKSNNEWMIIDEPHDRDREYYTLLNTETPYKYQLRIKSFLMALARNRIAEVAFKRYR